MKLFLDINIVFITSLLYSNLVLLLFYLTYNEKGSGFPDAQQISEFTSESTIINAMNAAACPQKTQP